MTNQTRYSSVSSDAIVTGPGSNVASYVPATGLLSRTRQASQRDTRILSNQTNALARFFTGLLHHDLTGGLEFSREKASSPAFTSVTLLAIPVARPDPGALPSGTPVRSGASTNIQIDTAALYAFDTVKFSEHWQLNGSLRWERAKTAYLSVAVNGAPTAAVAANDLLSWKTGLVLKPVAAGSLYAACGISLTPPGTDFTLSTAAGNQNNPNSAPQRTTGAELGVKWEFFHARLTTTAAIFKTENDKTVFTDPILGAIPAGKQRVQGLELNASGQLTDRWFVFAGFACLDSQIAAGTTAGNNPSGAQLPLTPCLSGNLWTTYRLPVGLTLGGGTQYVGDVNRRDATTTVPRTMPAYWLFNALASYDITARLSLRLNANNLFGRDYVQSYNNNGARFNPGAPRAYLLTANFKF
jgi:catecholate siderophore receptor